MTIRVTILLFAMLIQQAAMAQLSKEEMKQWKRQAKSYVKDPESLKKLGEAKATSDSEVRQLKSDNKLLTEDLSKKDEQISELEELISRVRVDAAVTKAELEKLKAGMGQGQAITAKGAADKKSVGSKNTDWATGVVFKVQIGAFRNKDLSKYFDNNPNFGGEAGKEPTDPQRINLGLFRDYWEADAFKKYLREMGVKDAWIVPYRDGIRVEIRDVLGIVVGEETPKQD